MKVETVSRFAVGALMIILFASILLSGKKELIVLLLTSIQIKVFHVSQDLRGSISAIWQYYI